ncbi:MAG: hypothetical protein JO069_03785, partial [Verrucomicrobia bacterium]|nr:hypothetical protein [Verrucomicrobiota bacterium]
QADTVIQLITGSGLQGLEAFGLSTRRLPDGRYLMKSYLCVPNPTGFLWEPMLQDPHTLEELNLLPANTEAFTFGDFSFERLWQVLSQQLSASQWPEVAETAQALPQVVQRYTGLTLDELLGSLGDHFGFVVTLDPLARTKIPLGRAAGEIEIPEPAAALLWQVRDDKVFSRLEAVLSQASAQVTEVNEPGLRMRVVEGVPMPYVRPTLARFQNYLIIASNDQLVRSIRDVASGKMPGWKSRPEVNAWLRGMPDKGNYFQYFGPTFQDAYYDLQLRMSQTAEQGPIVRAWMQNFMRFMQDYASYSVFSRVDDGWLTVAKVSQDPGAMIGQAAGSVGYYGAQAEVDALKAEWARQVLDKIKVNLKAIEDAKNRVVEDRNLNEGAVITRQDLASYLPVWPKPIIGETYEIGPVGEPPSAVAPVDLGEYSAGTRIRR